MSAQPSQSGNLNQSTNPSTMSTGGKPPPPPPPLPPKTASSGKNGADQKKEDDKKKKQEEDKRQKEDAKNQKKEEEKRQKEDAKNQKKEEEKRKKEEEKRKKEDEKHKKEEEKKQKKENEKHKIEDEKRQKKEQEKRKKVDAKNQKKEDEKHKKEAEKRNKEDAKNRNKEEEQQKKEDAKNQKKDEEKQQKEDATNRNKEEDKNEDPKKTNDEEKKPQEDKKPTKEEAKQRKAEEKARKKAGKQKNKKKTGGCCTCRAGVCKCWYCCWCHCLLPPFLWLYGMVLLGFSLYYALKYTLELEKDQQEDSLMFLYWGTFSYALLFVILVQMAYLLVLFESTNKCGRFMFVVLFILALLLCLAVFVYSIYCPEWCIKGKPVPINETVVKERAWRQRIPEQVFHLLLAAALTLVLFIILLHLYLYNTLQFLEEKELRENKVAYCRGGNPSEDAARSQASRQLGESKISFAGSQQSYGRITKYHTESELNNNNSFAAIARRYRSISYERSVRTQYTGLNTQFGSSTRRSNYDSTC